MISARSRSISSRNRVNSLTCAAMVVSRGSGYSQTSPPVVGVAKSLGSFMALLLSPLLHL
jgi:hypothetical protein